MRANSHCSPEFVGSAGLPPALRPGMPKAGHRPALRPAGDANRTAIRTGCGWSSTPPRSVTRSAYRTGGEKCGIARLSHQKLKSEGWKSCQGATNCASSTLQAFNPSPTLGPRSRLVANDARWSAFKTRNGGVTPASQRPCKPLGRRPTSPPRRQCSGSGQWCPQPFPRTGRA